MPATWCAGSSEQGKVDGEGAGARFNEPFALALDDRETAGVFQRTGSFD